MAEERRIFIQGNWKHDAVKLKVVPSTWSPTEEQIEIVRHRWKGCPSEIYDGALWRFENCKNINKTIVISVSKCSYKWHYILRDEIYPNVQDYPNLLSVTPLILSEDLRLFLGVRQGHDQANQLHAVGAGFIEPVVLPNPDDPSKWFITSENPFNTASREIEEESSLISEKDFSIKDMNLLGIVRGNNKDTTCVILVPVYRDSDEIEARGSEHSETFFVHISKINDVISHESIHERPTIKATDHLILALKLLMEYF